MQASFGPVPEPGQGGPALDTFDEPAAQGVLDRLVSDLSVPAVLRDIVLPFLAELGQRWEQGTASIAQEHFASNLIRGRLAGLARGRGDGRGPRAILACPPAEMHDLALMIFGIALNRAGWRIDYLGADTPVGELAGAVHAQRPDLVVLAATRPQVLGPDAEDVTQQVFVSAWRSRGSFDRGRGTLGGWLVRITRNKVADALRNRQRENRVLSQVAGGAAVRAPDAPPDQVVDRIVLADELAQLPEAQRLVMVLAFYSDLTHEQVA